ncbi:hypothetical protein GBAR_LOCUS28871 [Geodia barretti]|uniref:Uncharacterized protein n=1 Tax=Geodia barretti TaxID=519541 RepID=A0AA35XHP4_GEOBA|nr:hypothetical protein GBAR_LOCUS28871 [Geodia barretti]
MEQGCQEVPNLSPYNSTDLCQSRLHQSSRELTASLLTRPSDCLSRTSNQTRRRKRFLSCFPSTDECLTCKKHPNRRSVAFVYMCEEGGNKAISSLNGFTSNQTSKPLIVELSHEPTGAVSLNV